MWNQIFFSQRLDRTELGEAGRRSWARMRRGKTPESLKWGRGGGRRKPVEAFSVGLSVNPHWAPALSAYKAWNSK